MMLKVLICGSLMILMTQAYIMGPPQNSFDRVMQNFLNLQDLLDKTIPRSHQVGHIGWLNTESLYYWNIAHNPNFKHICEVGFGNGFSSTLFLTAGNATMISFDLFPKVNQYYDNTDQSHIMKHMPLSQTAARKYISELFPGRFTAYEGYSTDSVPTFIKENPGYKCDIILIDGSHRYEPTLFDIRNFKTLATKDTVLLFDDLDTPGVHKAVGEAIEGKIIQPMIECIKGEVIVDKHFARSGIDVLAKPLEFCQTKYVF